nr:hypothetical protein [uncultured Desulfuromonas sp.]
MENSITANGKAMLVMTPYISPMVPSVTSLNELNWESPSAMMASAMISFKNLPMKRLHLRGVFLSLFCVISLF